LFVEVVVRFLFVEIVERFPDEKLEIHGGDRDQDCGDAEVTDVTKFL
jgi:hypothetical protein